MGSKPKKSEKSPFEKTDLVTIRIPKMYLQILDLLLIDFKCIYVNRSDFIRQAIKFLICHDIEINMDLKKYLDERSKINMMKYIQASEKEAEKLKKLN